MTHDRAAPAIWMSFAAVCGLLGTWILVRFGSAADDYRASSRSGMSATT
jgi:hypothetical protein